VSAPDSPSLPPFDSLEALPPESPIPPYEPPGGELDDPSAPDVLPLLAPEILVATVSAKGELLHANEAWGGVFGTNGLWTELSSEDRRFAEEYAMEAAAGSLVTNQVFLLTRPGDEQPSPVLLHFVPVRLGDAGAGRLPVVVMGEVLREPASWALDQTKRRRMEMLGQMAMGIAHDFNNLLTSILGHVELLKAVLAEGEHAEHLRPMERAALDGAALVRKIQRYIRHEKEERFALVNLATIVEETAALTRPYWQNEPRRIGIDITLQREVEQVPPVRGSEPELREVLVNLVLNAVQAMPEGGTLTLRAFGDQQAVYVEVEDTGVGMPESVRQRIFEPLFTTKGESGTGMGLTVSYGIVEEHDGRIDVRSRPGHGTCFTLRFPTADTSPAHPADDGDAPAEECADEPGDAPRSLRLLVVDDEPMVRTVTAKLLRMRGHEVTEAGGGHDALHIVSSCSDGPPFDLIVTDLGMPEMSGAELAYHLGQVCPTIPIVLLTGHTDAEDRSDHVTAVVKKPFRIDALDATLQRVYRKALAQAGGA
jgi:two-component system, cell cycle sensor histidine kinase and response regulator CckA